MLQYVINQYGKERVVSLGSFQYIRAKGTIKDIGRVLNIPFEVTNEMTFQLGDLSIGKALELGLLDEYKSQYPELFEYAQKLSGLPKSFSAHPCFPADTLILTDNGYKEISDVQVGDLVLTHTNNYKLVVNKTVNNGSTICIKHTSGFDIECTSNHPIYVRHKLKPRRKIFSEPEWVNARDVVKTDMVCIPIDSNSIIPKYKSLKTDNKDFWWVVGRYIGDGWCLYYERPRNTKNVVICCDNRNEIELNEIVSKLKSLFEYRYEYNKTTYKIYIHNIELFEYLQRFGKYAHGKHLSKDIINLPTDLLESFLEGYFSADGNVNKQGFISAKTVSKKLAQGLIQCIAKTYHKQCGAYIIPSGIDIIEGRHVNHKEKYVIYFQKPHKKQDRCFYDEQNNCIWSYVKSVCSDQRKETLVYNLSVVDDNSYTANGVAVHNCGKVCSMDDITYYNATDINDEGLTILQGDMHTADDLGLIKADFLGLRTVDVIYDTLDMIGKDYEYIAPHNLNFKDEKVLANFRNGFTSGIFQFESSGMQDTLKKIECNSIYDLTVANALYRPGSIKYIDNYAARRKGLEQYSFLHPDLEPILKDSYGIIVFQEQLIEIGRLAKLSNPDELRKATAKKKAELLDKIKPELFSGLKDRGWTEDQINQLWESMLNFALYSFNKAHAAAYAITAYICMYLKTYHPKEFLCAWINSVSNKVEKVAECIAEAKRLGVKIYLGKYNNCSPDTKIYKDGIMIGTITIKHCNKEMADELMNLFSNKTKIQAQSFIEVLDMLAETNINVRQLNALILLNFFSDFGKSKYLLSVLQLYDGIKLKGKTVLPSFRTCKQINKDKVESYSDYGITEFLLKKYSAQETPKRYSDLDNMGLLKELSERLSSSVEDFNIQEKIKTEMELLGYTLYSNPAIPENYYIVTDFKTFSDELKPMITLRILKTGEEVKTKIKNPHTFQARPFKLFSILQIDGFTWAFKKRKINDKWQSTDETEPILEAYSILKE